MRIRLIPWAFTLVAACGGAENNGTRSGVERPDGCPETSPAPSSLPGVLPEHRSLAYWLERQAGDLDTPLLEADEIADHNRALSSGEGDEESLSHQDLNRSPDSARIEQQVRERLAYIRELIADGTYVDRNGGPLAPPEREQFDDLDPFPTIRPALRQAEAAIRLRCGPRTQGLFKTPIDLDFDRNNCSMIRSGEPLQLLADWRGMHLVRTPYAVGWIDRNASLAPLDHYDPPSPRPLTRRTVLEAAFSLLDKPYGWGGHEGGIDCSRFVMEVLGSFGIQLPRHSSRQAQAGTFTIDVPESLSDRERTELLDRASRRGVALIHFPGHIMMYLGKSEEGAPMAIHAFSEYVEPCADGIADPGDDPSPAETIRRVDRVTVTGMELGRGTTRRSFLERMTRIAVLGRSAGVDLQGAALHRPAATMERPETSECRDSLQAAIFRSPAIPHRRAPLRVVATMSEDPGPVTLTLWDPNGEPVDGEIQRLGGPPFTLWSRLDAPSPGRWTATVGDGSRIIACEQFSVRRSPPAVEPDTAAWTPRWRWEQDVENLYAAFVEQLLDYPIEDDRTWTNLQSLLTDSDRNLLHNHLGQLEDEEIRLEPDCADLPYFLRAYFAWKARLPFGFRRCSRGRAGRPPSCGELESNLIERTANSDVEAFSAFARTVRDGVHSASARTAPSDSQTDLYPVPLTRQSLRPGTVFADPYGHLLVIADWIPQATDNYGILVGVDAQPDGTIGRRRFWRGSFLFDPSTEDVGAGFKAWRPVIVGDDGAPVSLDNRALSSTTAHTPFSRDQYEGTRDAFYNRMETLINPLPLDPARVLATLVDALEESVTRRLVSVKNGIEYMEQTRWRTVEMPTGYAVFETSGAWEDFATPARDLRLLISIDAVRGFPERVRENPDQFGVAPADAAALADSLRVKLDEELADRTFTYVGSNGTDRSLTLRDVVSRAEDFEMAYNPNDCVEIRWATPEGAAEREACQHRAPPTQRQRMLEYRDWFVNRRRPPR